MITLAKSLKNPGFSLILLVVLGFTSVFGLSACGGDSADKAVIEDADPKGFYTGSAAIKASDDTTDIDINDLEGMVSGNRFMFLSVDQVLLYDGTITSISGNDYTASVDIYQNGALLASTTVSGRITSASSITGTFAGTGAGNGSFTLTYSLNNAPSDLSRIDIGWRGPLNGASGDVHSTFIDSSGVINRTGPFLNSTPVLLGCNYDTGSTVLPIADVNVYKVNLNITGCTDSLVDGTYSGYATTQTAADVFLVIAFTNGSYSGSGDVDVD